MALQVGEKYLTIKLTGHETVPAFKNKKKVAGSNEPDYKSDGCAVWINEKKPEGEVTKTTEPDL